MTGTKSTASLAAAALTILQLVAAQNPGTLTPESHPGLTTYQCTASGCTEQQTSVVLDWNSRWIHTANGQTNCKTSSGGMDPNLCPDEATCARNCVVEGVNYGSSGVSTSGSSLTMSQYNNQNGQVTNASPRVYLLGDDGNYVNMQLNGGELTYTTDVSNLPCGENGALYFSQMDPSGGRSQTNQGGANYGAGYCDAQCPVQQFRNGTLNTSNQGYCCNEMDIQEANSVAMQMTPHNCNADNTQCDPSGCGWNAYSAGNHNYWMPHGTIDTSQPVTVTTQFITSDGSATGALTNIKRIYRQNGNVVGGGDQVSSCGAFGGLPTMGKALESGMVLVMSIWNDNSQDMNWLDSGNSGPCSSSAGNPGTIQSQDPGTHVIFSDIKWGTMGSTTGPNAANVSSSKRAAPKFRPRAPASYWTN